MSLLSRWMAVDLYLREVDNLRFELSMNQCSEKLSKLARDILEKGVVCWVQATQKFLDILLHLYIAF